MHRRLRVGVVGGRRGVTLARGCQMAGMDVVAVCDLNLARLSSASSALGAVPYQDSDAFLAQDLEGVILANFFDAHAPLAIKALKAGKHVMSETTVVSFRQNHSNRPTIIHTCDGIEDLAPIRRHPDRS